MTKKRAIISSFVGVLALGLLTVVLVLLGQPPSVVASPTPGFATSSPSTPGPVSSTTVAPIPVAPTPLVPTPLAQEIPRGGGAATDVSGAILPNGARTPGEVNPDVTQADINQTICVTGWTATVRPPSSYTTGLKVRQLASGYAYGGDMATADYEEDHLISLELGGSPTAEANLWPEPYNAPEGARVKDVIENKLHTMICSGAIDLATAQAAIASNWWVAYETYVTGSPSVANPAPAPAPVPAPAPAPVPAQDVPAGAHALCKDGTYWFTATHQGACSHHGGVATFY